MLREWRGQLLTNHFDRQMLTKNIWLSVYFTGVIKCKFECVTKVEFRYCKIFQNKTTDFDLTVLVFLRTKMQTYV